MKKTACTLFMIAMVLFSRVSTLYASERNLAILIGVTHYDSDAYEDDRSSLRVGGDVAALSERFAEGGNGFEVVTLTGDSATRDFIQQTLREKLAPNRCQFRDTVIVYFSGHGTVSAADSNRVLLAVKDSSNEESTFLAANDIRQSLARCGAANTLFILDACHSGGVKNDAQPIVRDTSIPGVVTLASCQNTESSGTWAEKNMSNFSYWLNEALKGYADSDLSGSVDTEELANYVTANLRFKTKLQHPVVVKHPDTEHFPVFKPRSRQLYAVLDDIAEQIILYASLKNIQSFHSQGFLTSLRVGTFRSSGLDDEEFNDIKKVSTFCASELERRVGLKSRGEVTISPHANAHGPSLQGTIRRKEKRYFLSLTCTLSATKSDSEGQEETQQVKISQQFPIRAAYEAPAPQAPPADYVPCQVFLEVKTPNGYVPRAIEKIRGQYYAALDAGEVYRVVVQRFQQPGVNPRRLGLKLFVDGCSTIPQALSKVSASKFQIAGEAATSPPRRPDVPAASTNAPQAILSSPAEVEAPNIPLDAASFYFLCGQDVDSPYNFNAQHPFHGFLKTTGESASYREFLVAPGNESVGSGENIGLITAAFYELVNVPEGSATRGTIEGGWGTTRAPEVHGMTTGPLLQKVTIRYVPQNELETYRQGAPIELVHGAE
ncbi:MAG: caspase family protein [Planctomycetia bacterium]|nr:caspase family protein [Planctomycetia bacterium]